MTNVGSASGAGETRAGAAVIEITPAGSVFLFGYPHVPRMSTGVHDPLECAVLYLSAGEGRALFLANDLIYFGRDYARSVRERIARETGVPAAAILLGATHTHSGPPMTNNLAHASDPVVGRVDESYLAWLSDRLVEAAVRAVRSAVPAEVGLAVARAEGVGSNRHDPAGPTDPEVSVLVARSSGTRQPIGCMVVYGMHPTVLHEDSKLISADFPGFTRRWLRAQALPPSCPVIYLNGASGNQSPRHITRSNTFPEAQRIGENLGRSIAPAIAGIAFGPLGRIKARRAFLDLIPRQFPAVEEAEERLRRARARFDELRRNHAPRQEVRTAECDVFGAEETMEFSRAAADGRLAAAMAMASPAEIQVIGVGDWKFVGWPGEFFVEHGLALKSRAPDTHLVTLANGELQGYIATPEAVARGAYEATNALFDVSNGPRFVARTLELLREM